MATYAIGDIQGCFKTLHQLLDRIAFDPGHDRLWLVGDLVNRGPDSLVTLRFLQSLGTSVRPVLGNHDLFLLAAAEGVVSLRPKDTIQDVLAAEDQADLTHWLRHQPFFQQQGPFFMVHAGLLPQWTIDEAVAYSKDVEAMLTGSDYRSFLQQLFHGPALQWNASLKGSDRLVSIARVFTRLRVCTPAGEMSNYSGPPEEAPAGFSPWFSIPDRRSRGMTIITGHWAALGLHMEPDILAIDSGCVWGRRLTAVRLEDRTVYQVEYADRRE